MCCQPACDCFCVAVLHVAVACLRVPLSLSVLCGLGCGRPTARVLAVACLRAAVTCSTERVVRTLLRQCQPQTRPRSLKAAVNTLACTIFFCTNQVLELGSGPGVPGLIAARVARKAFLTDYHDEVSTYYRGEGRWSSLKQLLHCLQTYQGSRRSRPRKV